MSDTLQIMLIPFQENAAVLLPRNLTEYVLPYAPPLPSSYSKSALVGSLIYQNEKVPVVDLESLYQDKAPVLPAIGSQARLVMVSCLTSHGEFTRYALIANQPPLLLMLDKSDLVEEADDALPSFFHSRVMMKSQNNREFLFVPDLIELEKTLFST